ncbi:MAG: ABC transporter substrate-binding protein [Lachnospiraceae bacterium]|nr:ABC transporter substrate-binding protein [Lachnospiraceae bacterium]
MKKKKLAAILTAITLAGSMLGGCGGKESTADPGTEDSNITTQAEQLAGEHGKSVTIAFSEGLIKLDPHDQSVSTGITMNDMIFDSLYEADHEGGYTPRLATGYEVSEDGLEWTIHIREGVTFHDGEVLDADDVVCTFQRLIDTPTLNEVISYWTALAAVEKIDDYTVKLTLSEPAVAAATMGLANTVIIPNEAYETQGTALFTDQIMTGSGPWIFDEWVDGQYVHFTKNENYWNGGNDSYFDDVYIRFVAEASTAISAQITGEIDGYYNVSGIPQDLISLYGGSENLCELIPVPVSAIDYLGFQYGEGSAFHDVNVRRAFSMAIDRQGIIDGLLGGGAICPGIANNKTLGYDESLSSQYYTYDPDGAKALLESTGYKGEEITISSVAAFNNIALAICDMVNAIGFNCKAEVVEAATLADIRSTGDYDAFIVTAFHSSGDLYQFINWRVTGDAHHSDYKNDELNNLVDQSNKESDNTVRDSLFKQANAIIADECAPMVSLAQLENMQSVNYGITGVNFLGDAFCLLKDIDYDPSLEK